MPFCLYKVHITFASSIEIGMVRFAAVRHNAPQIPKHLNFMLELGVFLQKRLNSDVLSGGENEHQSAGKTLGSGQNLAFAS
jgi:hypothetical protein